MPTNITLASKYLEDENGNKFAPITTPNAVRFPDGTNLNDHLGGAQATPIVALGQPSGDIYDYTISFDSSASKFYQYLWDDNRGIYTWQEIATPEKAFAYYNNGQGTSGFYEIDNGVLSQTLISILEAGWYADFTGLPAASAGYAGTISYMNDAGKQFSTVSPYETSFWNSKSDFSGDYNDLSNKPLPVGSGTATSLASLPVTNRMVVATISTNQSMVSIYDGISALTAGLELHVVVKATAAVTITLPTSSPYINMNADTTLSLDANSYAEINFISDGTNIYVRAIS